MGAVLPTSEASVPVEPSDTTPEQALISVDGQIASATEDAPAARADASGETQLASKEPEHEAKAESVRSEARPTLDPEQSDARSVGRGQAPTMEPAVHDAVVPKTAQGLRNESQTDSRPGEQASRTTVMDRAPLERNGSEPRVHPGLGSGASANTSNGTVESLAAERPEEITKSSAASTGETRSEATGGQTELVGRGTAVKAEGGSLQPAPVLSPSTSASQTVPAASLTQTEVGTSAVDGRTLRQLSDRILLLATSRRKDPVVVRLEPRDLGVLTITVHQAENQVEATVAASNDQVRAALQQTAPVLQQSLEARGLQLASLNIESQTAGMGGFGDRAGQFSSGAQQQPLPFRFGEANAASPVRMELNDIGASSEAVDYRI
ncbi:MAG: flagellar hook-length control protein FliK [Fimbriimonadales bacterium]